MTDDAQVHKEYVARLYGRVAAAYGRIGPDLFAPFGRFLVARMQLSPGERVLDVATGRGAVLFAAAEQVGPTGFVVGIDLALNKVTSCSHGPGSQSGKRATAALSLVHASVVKSEDVVVLVQGSNGGWKIELIRQQ